MNIKRMLLFWTVLSLALGGIGGLIGLKGWDAPFYFGFFFGFTLTGLAGLFAMAAAIEEHQYRK